MVKSRKIQRVIVFSVIAVLFIISGCSSQLQGSTSQVLEYDLHDEPETLDPARVSDVAGKQLVNAIYEGLLRQKPDGSYENAMAIDWTMEEMGEKYVFKMRDVNWSDGEKVTAQDFVFAWKRVLDPHTKSPLAYLLYDIKNAEGYNRSSDKEYHGVKTEADDVAIYSLDDETLVIELRQANPGFFKKLNHPVFFPIPQHVVKEFGEHAFELENLKGNGPFLLSEHIAGSKYILNKNLDYWDEKNVSLDAITCYIDSEKQDTWQMFNKDKIDLTLHIPQDQLEEEQQLGRLQTSPIFANYYYQFNTNSKPLKDNRVRRALSMALNREALVNEVLQGRQKAARGLIPHNAQNNLLLDNNLEDARKLLVEAGFSDGVDFPELEMLVDNEESHLYLADALQTQWKDNLGINVNIIPLSWEERKERIQLHEYDLALSGWIVDYADKIEFLERYVFRIGQNTTGWSNSEYDNWVNIAKGSINEEERIEALRQADSLLMIEMPVLPLYDYTRVVAIKEGIEGCYLPPAGVELEFKWISKNEE